LLSADALWASEAPNENVRIDITERPGSYHATRTPKCAVRMNEPEVNQTKPKLVTVGDKIRADSAGYAPQALVPLYDVNSVFTLEPGSERNWYLFNHGYFARLPGGQLKR
jgi:hypothetical protein